MNIGIGIGLIVRICAVFIGYKVTRGVIKDAYNNYISGNNAPMLDTKSVGTAGNNNKDRTNNHLNNPDVENKGAKDEQNAIAKRKGIFTPLNNTLGALGKKVANSKMGRAGRLAAGAAMAVGGGVGAAAAVGARVGAAGIKALDKKIGASRKIKGFAKPIIKDVKYKASTFAGNAKKKMDDKVNEIKENISNAIPDETKRKIKMGMDKGKFYKTLAGAKLEHYKLQAKNKYDAVNDTLKLGADIARNSYGGQMAKSGVKMMADAIRGNHGPNFTFSNQPSRDKLNNRYHATREQSSAIIDRVIEQTSQNGNNTNTSTVNDESHSINEGTISPVTKAWRQARINEVIEAQRANGIDVKNAKVSAAFTSNNYLRAAETLRQTISASNLSQQDRETKNKMLLDLTVNAKKQHINLNSEQMLKYTEEAFAKTQEAKQEIERQAEENAREANSKVALSTLNKMISEDSATRQNMEQYIRRSFNIESTSHNKNVHKKMV